MTKILIIDFFCSVLVLLTGNYSTLNNKIKKPIYLIECVRVCSRSFSRRLTKYREAENGTDFTMLYNKLE